MKDEEVRSRHFLILTSSFLLLSSIAMPTRPPQELLDFSGKVVLVTGAGSGIGRAIALRFAQAGAAVSLHYRDSEAGARSAADEIIHAGGRAEIVRADLRF